MRIRNWVLLLALSLSSCATARIDTRVPLQLAFKVDRNFDIERIIAVFRHQDPAGLELRAKRMGIDPILARKIRDSIRTDEFRPAVEQLVAERFDQQAREIEGARLEFEALWKPLLRVFSDVVIQSTESQWLHNPYVCIVSSYHPGLSDWYGSQVAVKFDSTPIQKRRILAHEITLSHVFQLSREKIHASDVTEQQLWAFSEITAAFILDHERLRPFWPAFPRAGAYFRSSNYPQLSILENKLLPLFETRDSFEDYLQAAVPVLRDFNRLRKTE